MDMRDTHRSISKSEFNNDSEKCIQALEQESQRSLYGSSQLTDQNSHPASYDYGGNLSTYMDGISSNNNNSFSSSVTGTVGAPPPPRYQELPVRHETKHVSTVQRTFGPAPSVPPRTESTFTNPTAPGWQGRTEHQPLLLIHPANQAGMPPQSNADFSQFLESSSRSRDIPNIGCVGPSSFSVGSPTESRRPVKVINVQGKATFSGGTVTTGPNISPNMTSSHIMVVRGDGGGMCSHPVSGSTASPATTSFIGSPYISPSSEPERPTIHSSSIYIDSNPRQSGVQESRSNLPAASMPVHHQSAGQLQMADQGHSSLSVGRTFPPLNISHGLHNNPLSTPQDRGNVVSYLGIYGGSPGVAGNRFCSDAAAASAPQNVYSVSLVTHNMNQISISPNHLGQGTVGPSSHTPPSPLVISSATPPFGGMPTPRMPRSPSLQHQRSTGSSTSRSNSVESEHGSIHHLPDYEFQTSQAPMPSLSHHPRSVVGMGVMMPVLSPASSQSSLSSESSARDRDHNSIPRQRSGSMQEEAAYSQALLVHQHQRMEKLKEETEEKRIILQSLRNEVSKMEKSKIEKSSARTTFPTADDIAGLCESNRRLQTDIQMYLNEIDMYKNGQVPFTNIDPMEQQNFFNNMPTGPNDLTYTRPPIRNRTPPPPLPPPRAPPIRQLTRPPPPVLNRINSEDLSQVVPVPSPDQSPAAGSGDSEEGDSWNCSACTFRNHPALKKCEMCEMPRMMPGRNFQHHPEGMVGSVSMPHLHRLGSTPLHHKGAGGEVCYCHNMNCQQKMNKL
ncbi:TGF-beta-activated kinase 1 and MAP3K7-binding protein 3-like isoform X2 [Pomacea canaliculata]|uniref:TGF-beta-activated kinase 1 and MAP3K7-binding protein 3-like isoform X2 n=1 Tax=Pomacea canaliculata TaxID=400727 RepID=UPI000D7260A8|nr:TGF-beta-activated kinase 1 and MAP3K7-binding protein 3-like isoform X2 [Pomacea canaliculata]